MKHTTPPAEGKFSRISVPLITAIIVALCGLLYWQAGQLRKHQKWVDHSYQVRLSIVEVDRSLRGAESIQRAMLLTGGTAPGLQLEFDNSMLAVMKHLRELRKLVADNPSQSRLVQNATESLLARLEMLQRNARDLPSLAESERPSRILEGVDLANQVEANLKRVDQSEEVLLQGRAQAGHLAGIRLLMLATGGSAFGLAVMVLTLVHERRNRRIRDAYQNRLAEARDTALNSVKATSIFVASVSHEIRTPMNGVLGAADLLRQDRRLDRRQRELVDTIRYSGEALLGLINDILDLSKLQAGKMDFSQEDFSLTEVLDESLALFADSAGRKRLELAHRIDPELPDQFHSDPGRLRQVLVNLVGNAVKFTDSGSISVDVRLRARENGHLILRFRVTDTGTGISEEQQKRLFEPFSQVSSDLSRRHGGTGLGLAISREIVERLGGTMGVESSPGAGSTFWFTVRIEPASDQKDRCERLCDGGSLLLIESRKLTATSIEQHVKAWGMKVVTSTNDQTLTQIGKISDLAAVLIGESEGIPWQAVAKAVAQRADAKEKPVFLLCHPHEQPSPHDISEGHIDACLRFPFRPSDLYDLLTREKTEHHEDPAPGELALPKARILLVEDNPINQRIFSRQLEMLGLDFEIRGDGHEGAEARTHGGFDLILMDCQLPTVDGFEATRRIRKWETETEATRLPIIAITAHVMTGDAEACFQAGMDDYLPKPFDLAKLRTKLSGWLHADENGEILAASAPTAKPAPEVIDTTQMSECLTGEESLDQSLISDALAEIGQRREEMAQAIIDRDDAAWRAAAHRAVGTAAVLGFAELAAGFRTAEHDNGAWGAREATLSSIKAPLERTRAALRMMGLLAAAGIR